MMNLDGIDKMWIFFILFSILSSCLNEGIDIPFEDSNNS